MQYLIMNNSICTIFFIGLISIYSPSLAVSPPVQPESDTASSSRVNSQSSASTSNQSSPLPQTDQSLQPKLPTLTCILFQDFGCNIQCYLIESLRGLKTVGTCIPDNFCSCTVVDMPLEKLWRLKFESTGLLKEIQGKENVNLAKNVLEALQDPYRTAEQSVEDLRLILSPEQLEKLHVKHFKETGKPNPNFAYLRNYVDREWKSLVENNSELQAIYYKKSLLEYLKENESNPGLRNVFSQILLTRNDALKGLLAEFLVQHKNDDVGKYDLLGEEKLLWSRNRNPSANEILNNIIINKLIKEVDAVIRVENRSEPVIPLETQPTKPEIDQE